MNLSLAKHALVSGGASGIGLGIADALSKRGIPVTIADINAEALAEVTAARGNSVRGALLDTREREQWQKVKAEAEAAFGPVDILVNNAGIAPDGLPISDGNADSFDRIMAINFGGIYNGVLTFAADMRARGRGHIVNTSSQAGLVTVITGVGAYSAAKFGVTGLTEALRTEMVEYGVGVTLLCPGAVKTNLAANTEKIGGQIRKYSGEMPDSGVTPDHVGEMVADGIEQNLPLVVTQGDMWPAIEQRMLGIKAACDYRNAR